MLACIMFVLVMSKIIPDADPYHHCKKPVAVDS